MADSQEPVHPEPAPNATCLLCDKRYATTVCDLPFCIEHAEQAISFILTGK